MNWRNKVGSGRHAWRELVWRMTVVAMGVGSWAAVQDRAEAAFLAVGYQGDTQWERNEWLDFLADPNPVPPNLPDGYGHRPDMVSELFGVGAGPVVQAGAPTLTTASFGPPTIYTSTGNLYNPSARKSYVVSDSPGLAGAGNGLSQLALQTRTSGGLLDYASMELRYQLAGGGQGVLAPTSQQEVSSSTVIISTPGGTFPSTTVDYLWEWVINPQLGITSYELAWVDAGSSVSLEAARLDSLVGLAIPEPGRAALVGLGLVGLVLRRRRAGRPSWSEGAGGVRGRATLMVKRSTEAGFTLVELLVVIVIIGILAAVTVPVVGGIKGRAAATEEVAGARALVSAYLDHAIERNGRLLSTAKAEVIEGPRGTELPAFMAQRYPAALGSYLGWDFVGTVLVGDSERYAGDFYRTTVYPTFGLNDRFLGGSRALEPRAIQRLDQSPSPNSHLVFASARHDPAGRSAKERVGFYRIVPPRSNFVPDGGAFMFGYVDLRHGGRCVAAFLDGTVSMLSESEVSEGRIWSGGR